MARSLKARSGSSLKTEFAYSDDQGNPIDTTGSTARIQIRAYRGSARVILTADESEVPGSTLELLDPGRWGLYLGASVTKSLPPSAIYEVELVSNTDDEDVITLETGVIWTAPERVKSFD